MYWYIRNKLWELMDYYSGKRELLKKISDYILNNIDIVNKETAKSQLPDNDRCEYRISIIRLEGSRFKP